MSFTEASISEEPSAVVPHAGICAGAVWKSCLVRPPKTFCLQGFKKIMGTDFTFCLALNAGGQKKTIPTIFREINVDGIRGLSVFIGKNSKALKRRKYKGFCVFLLYEILVMLLKYGENEAKKAEICIFMSLKALQNKGFSEIWSYRRFLRLPKVIYPIFKIGV